MSNSPGMMYLQVKLTLLAAEKSRKLSAVLLDTKTILFPSITIVVLGLGKLPVPSITVAPSRIITPSLFCTSVRLDIAVSGLAKAEATVGETSRKVNIATIPTDPTENRFILLFWMI